MYVCSTGEASPWRVESYHRSSVTHCLFTSNDDYTVTCDNGGEIRLINTNTGYGLDGVMSEDNVNVCLLRRRLCRRSRCGRTISSSCSERKMDLSESIG